MPPKTERFEMRLDPEMIERIDRWRREQPDLPGRAEAIRRLVDKALPDTAKKTARKSRP